MKKLFYISVCIISLNQWSFLSAQNSVVDQKNGFCEFKIGDDFSKWESNLSNKTDMGSGLYGYTYTGTLCPTAFDFSISEIGLVFKDNKIWAITVSLPTINFDDLKKLTSSADKLFGDPSYAGWEEAQKRLVRQWEGSKAVVTLFQRTPSMDQWSVYFQVQKSNGDGF